MSKPVLFKKQVFSLLLKQNFVLWKVLTQIFKAISFPIAVNNSKVYFFPSISIFIQKKP